MDRNYSITLLILTTVLAGVSILLSALDILNLPSYNWLGLAYLLAITLLIHAFVYAAKDNANSLIRRLMIASLLRMFLGILFLAVTLFIMQPVNLHFVLSYCVYFCVFMVFEISQMRTNLRPDLKQRPKNENA